MPIMSLRQYARHRGVALSAVQKAITSKRVSTLKDGRVDSETADAEWKRNTRSHAPAPTPTHRVDSEDDDGAVFGANQYTKARAVREHYQARLAKIDYEERVAKLVSGEEVQVAAFNKFRQFRDAMINLPDRLAAMLAAETTEATVHALLTAEIRKALIDFADESNG